MKRLIIALSLLLGTVTLVPAPASALFEASKQQACEGANLSDSNNDCNADNGENRVSGIIKVVVNILTVVVGVAAVILIILNGLRFITANGDASSITNARNGIIYALVGLAIAGFAQAIVRFFVDRL